MELKRRGFLGLLGASVASAAYDPDLALWKPGKLFSIPQRVHVPQWHQFHADFILPNWNVEPIGGEAFVERYLKPAGAAVKSRIEMRVRDAGLGNPQYSELHPVKGVEFCKTEHSLSLRDEGYRFKMAPDGTLPPGGRAIVAYDIEHDAYYGRVECLVKL